MTSGVHARAALINSLYIRSLSFTPKARTLHSNGALVNHLSTDISRIDYLFQWFHPAWTSSIQASYLMPCPFELSSNIVYLKISVCLTILCVQMGPSALAGFSLLPLLMPIEAKAMNYQLRMRQASMKFTDQRASLLREWVDRLLS